MNFERFSFTSKTIDIDMMSNMAKKYVPMNLPMMYRSSRPGSILVKPYHIFGCFTVANSLSQAKGQQT